MKFLKIKNVKQNDGAFDYKGLNINAIAPGTQLYPSDENAAYFQYDAEVEVHEDIEILNVDLFNEKKLELENSKSIDPIQELKNQNADLNLQIIELWEILIDGGVI